MCGLCNGANNDEKQAFLSKKGTFLQGILCLVD